MRKGYIKKCNTESEYLLFISSYDSAFPNISYISSTRTLRLKKNEEYEKKYLALTAVEDCKFKYRSSGGVLKYSLDNGITWYPFEDDIYTPVILKGNSILLKGRAEYGKVHFYSTGIFDVSGNIMSICSENNFENIKTITYKNAFNNLFKESLVRKAHNMILPALELKEYCYYGMFQGCTNLMTVPELPATTLAESCYSYMFGGCTSLITVPNNLLPATTLASHCYNYMFDGCTNLTTGPNLSATTLADGCYYSMFQGCTSLTTAPSLPATTLADYCYFSMFNGCINLTEAPELPSMTLANSCYYGMFLRCTSLTTAPILPATNLNGVSGCYNYMFFKCRNLNKVICYALNNTSNTYKWLFGVSTTGTLYKFDSMNLTNTDYGPPSNWEILSLTKLSTPLTFEAKEPNSNIIFTLSNLAIVKNIKYSVDNGISWQEYNSGTIITLDNIGDIILFKGEAISYFNSTFSSTEGELYVYGNVMSLLYLDNFAYLQFVNSYSFSKLFYNFSTLYNHLSYDLELPATILETHCYYCMFSGCSNLTKSPNLPATTLADYCYNEMFKECTSLTTTSDLPSTTLALGCYSFMFLDCENLIDAPTLPATKLAPSCYDGMFSDCTSLITAPSLPATTLEKNCYSLMFNRCTNLLTAPSLPATILKENCYNLMFGGCSSLTTAPELPATTLATGCYQYMFYNCVNLVESPILPAKTISYWGYTYMFKGCSNLTKITCYALYSISEYGDDTDINTYDWVEGVSSTGTFIKAAKNNNWTRGTGGIPSTWTVQDYSS